MSWNLICQVGSSGADWIPNLENEFLWRFSMSITRREFIQEFGIALASLVLARCAPKGREPKGTGHEAEVAIARERLRGIWQQFDCCLLHDRSAGQRTTLQPHADDPRQSVRGVVCRDHSPGATGLFCARRACILPVLPAARHLPGRMQGGSPSVLWIPGCRGTVLAQQPRPCGAGALVDAFSGHPVLRPFRQSGV